MLLRTMITALLLVLSGLMLTTRAESYSEDPYVDEVQGMCVRPDETKGDPKGRGHVCVGSAGPIDDAYGPTGKITSTVNSATGRPWVCYASGNDWTKCKFVAAPTPPPTPTPAAAPVVGEVPRAASPAGNDVAQPSPAGNDLAAPVVAPAPVAIEPAPVVAPVIEPAPVAAPNPGVQPIATPYPSVGDVDEELEGGEAELQE